MKKLEEERIENQKKLIPETDWNILIILDACRYDYFEEIYQKYLEGNLKKVNSLASTTNVWLKKIFECEDYDNTVYVSANPRVNGKRIEAVRGFIATDIFFKVVDVWDEGWNKKLDTVTPKIVGKATRMARAKYPNKRIISHFMQPHFPYLSLPGIGTGLSGPRSSVKKRQNEEEKMGEKVWKYISNLAIYLFGSERISYYSNKVGGIFGSQSNELTNFELVVQKRGIRGLRKAYRKNLESALKEISKLAKRLPGKMVITSDHGELLGENGSYGHKPNCDHPILREVPWLEIEYM